MNEELCGQCRKGVAPHEEKTFNPKCVGCQDKLARGLRTGKEPPPSMHPAARRKRLTPEAFEKYTARL